jgi:hypothetical protein
MNDYLHVLSFSSPVNSLLAYGNRGWINHIARSDALKEEDLAFFRKNSDTVISVL